MKKYFSQSRTQIELCGLRFSPREFRKLEPTLQELPLGIDTRFYEPGQGFYDMGNQYINCPGPWLDGDRYIDRFPEFKRLHDQLHADDAAIDENVQRELLKRQPWDVRRKAEYPDVQELVIAMWELLVEHRPEKAAAIQEKRLATKNRHPKE